MPLTSTATHHGIADDMPTDGLHRALALVRGHFSDSDHIVLVRSPIEDILAPDSGDLDLLVVDDVDEYLPHRLAGLPSDARPVDVIRIPSKLFARPSVIATHGLIPHRLLTSVPLEDSKTQSVRQLSRLREETARTAHTAARINGFMNLIADTVQEVGVTWDLPELALFWLHMSFAAVLAVLAEDVRLLCPNVYTRPFDFTDEIERKTRLELRARALHSLRLHDDPASIASALQRMYDTLAGRLSEPQWPENMRRCTRNEYRYFASRSELEWRIRLANELARNGHRDAAVFYLRFYAYMLACLPLVHQRAIEGIDVSFIRPQRAVLPDLQANCPEIVADFRRALGGRAGISLDDVHDALLFVRSLREPCLAALARVGGDCAAARPWRPHRSPPANRA